MSNSSRTGSGLPEKLSGGGDRRFLKFAEDGVMFDKIDDPSLKSLVEAFYVRVRRDDLIGPLFNEAISDWPHHLGKLQDFWSSVMLTSGRYKGQPLPVHVKHGKRIDAAAFRRWLALWAETTGDMFIPELAARLQGKAERIARSLQFGIQFAGGGRLNGARTALPASGD